MLRVRSREALPCWSPRSPRDEGPPSLKSLAGQFPGFRFHASRICSSQQRIQVIDAWHGAATRCSAERGPCDVSSRAINGACWS